MTNVRGQAGRAKRVQHATERRTRPCLHRACSGSYARLPLIIRSVFVSEFAVPACRDSEEGNEKQRKCPEPDKQSNPWLRPMANEHAEEQGGQNKADQEAE
jgi:hypothetical protein